MFGHARNAISAYQKAGVEAAVEVADPHRLILLLFEGAQAAVGAARAAITQKQIAAKGESISKAIDIISNGLKASLDEEKGGDLAGRLGSLYDYMVLRLLQANLVGPAGYISMEDTEATELVQRGTVRDGDKHSYIAMAREAPEQQDTVITENLIRRFWVGYQKLMGY